MLKLFKRIPLKRLLIYTTVAIIFASIITWYANHVVEKASASLQYSSVEKIPSAHVGLLLGTNPVSRGGPNLYFVYRIDAAEQLFKAGKIKYLIISGDNGRKEYDEPTEMKKALVARGIDSTKVVLDYAGFRTFDSVVRAKKIFGQDTIIFISQRFHNERAIYIAQQHDMLAYGYNAKDVSNKYGMKTIIREKFARVKVFFDILFGVQPHFLGEKISIPR